MSYVPRSPALRGLGYAFTIDGPFGQKTTINIPIEQAAKDAASIAMTELKTQGLKAAQSAAPALIKSIVPALLPVIQKDLLPPLIDQGRTALVSKIWPALEPQVRNEMTFAIGEAKGIAVTAALLVTLGICIPIAVSTLYLRREIRKGKA